MSKIGKYLGRAISLWPVVPQTLPHIPKSETQRSQPADHSAAFPPNREKTLKSLTISEKPAASITKSLHPESSSTWFLE